MRVDMPDNRAIFFPGLNGLRAIAALAVVLSHTTVYLGEFNLNPHIIGTLANGNPKGIDLSDFAVSIFFALSGFLITYLLLVEDRAGEINIKNFYVRRILRIWPLYYLYLIIALFFINIWGIHHPNYTNYFYIFFTANVPKILQEKSDLLGHYWSLGVEEQFYLFWPWVVKTWIKKLNTIVILLIIVLIAIKIIAHLNYPETYFEETMYTNRFDCMLIGAMGALLFFQNNELFIKFSAHILTQIAAWAAIFLALINKFHIANILNHEFMSIATVLLIIGQIKSKNKIINLDRGIFEFLGKISYGIYVIHPLIIFGLARVFLLFLGEPTVLHYILAYTGVTGLTILVSHVSYRYMEKPFLKLKSRFTTVKSMSSKQNGI